MSKGNRSRKARSSYAVRVGLIVLAAAAILSFAAYETGAISPARVVSWMFAPRAERLNVPAVPGARLLRSYQATFNGRKSQFAHYACRLSPGGVIEHYAKEASKPGRRMLAALPGAITAKRGHAMIGYRDSDGSTVGVVAFEDKDGGSVYFVGRTRPHRQRAGGPDVPGREPPDVPKPLRSTRVMCVENLAGLPSILSLYEGWGEIDDTVDLIRTQMTHAGWRRNASVEDVVASKIGGELLSYTRGVENCLIHIEREARTNRVATMIFYSQKPWLPAGKGF